MCVLVSALLSELPFCILPSNNFVQCELGFVQCIGNQQESQAQSVLLCLQFQSFSQYRNKLKNKSDFEIDTLKKNPKVIDVLNVWR